MLHRTPLRCLFCGEEERCELLEIYADHSFQIETCCEDLHHQVVADMAEDPDWATELLRRLDAGPIIGAELRRTVAVDGQFLLDWHPTIAPIDRRTAQGFIARWHRHNGPLAFDLFRAGAFNGPTLVGVAVVARPVARLLDRPGIAEVRRLCTRTDLPRELTWRVASTLYNWAAGTAASRGYSKIITYTMHEIESGLSLRYARWKPEAVTRAKSWNTPSRPRVDTAPVARRVRWVRLLPLP